MGWHMRHGPWWMIQWQWLGWLSVGVHVDFLHRRTADGLSYGPYVDLHLGLAVVSLGWHPLYAGSLDLQKSISMPRSC